MDLPQQIASAQQSSRVLLRMAGPCWRCCCSCCSARWASCISARLNRPFDAFYMTAITITTVGYGEVVDLRHTDAGRLFAALVSFIGFGTVTFIFTSLSVFFLETDLNEALRRRRMEKAILKLKNHYIVCGFGRVGRNVASELIASGRRFVAIEPDAETLGIFPSAIRAALHPGRCLRRRPAAARRHRRRAGRVRRHGRRQPQPDDLPDRAPAQSRRAHRRALPRDAQRRQDAQAGADVVVSPDFTGGMRIAPSMIRPHVVSFLDEMLRSSTTSASRRSRCRQPSCPAAWPRLGRRSPHHVLLGVRGTGGLELNPADDFMIQPGQILVIMGNAQGREALQNRLMTTT